MPGIGPVAASPTGSSAQLISVLVGATDTQAKTRGSSFFLQQLIARGAMRNAPVPGLSSWTHLLARGSTQSFGEILSTDFVLYEYLTATARQVVAGLAFGASTRLTGKSRSVVKEPAGVSAPSLMLIDSGTRISGRLAFRGTTHLSGAGATRSRMGIVEKVTIFLTGRSKISARDHLAGAIGISHLTAHSTTVHAIGVERHDVVTLIARGLSWAAGRFRSTASTHLSGQGSSAEQSHAGISGTVQVTAIHGRTAAGSQGRAAMSPMAMMRSAGATAVKVRLRPVGHVVLTAVSGMMAVAGATVGPQEIYVHLRARSKAMVAAMVSRPGGTAHLSASGQTTVRNRTKPMFSYPLSAASAMARGGGATFLWLQELVASSWHATLGSVQPLYFAPMPNVTPGRYVVNCNGRVRTVYRMMTSQEPCDC
jgi:hypothetical protein